MKEDKKNSKPKNNPLLQSYTNAISLSGIFFNIGKYIGICDAIDYFDNNE
jgi:hypothetical protein